MKKHEGFLCDRHQPGANFIGQLIDLFCDACRVSRINLRVFDVVFDEGIGDDRHDRFCVDRVQPDMRIFSAMRVGMMVVARPNAGVASIEQLDLRIFR